MNSDLYMMVSKLEHEELVAKARRVDSLSAEATATLDSLEAQIRLLKKITETQDLTLKIREEKLKIQDERLQVAHETIEVLKASIRELDLTVETQERHIRLLKEGV